ncbi:GNAT family N-acetyltransferase [Xanthomonas sp. XNM01]|uniref:GNAT family N-acetyltransferase n=1 Tax=Xanthomonas sp. XNM01 TaxID=2769289 RepID=UPI00177C4068|nr:GNAT family N-acetyltransferase [Xanthomonas sp. XNM01]MBD9368117.1 N-acetyltransferase [Xanthomonas sp. XNM01]
MTSDIQHDPAAARFSLVVDGWEAELTYRQSGERMVIDHTGVPAQIGGRGIAGRLVQVALEYARARGWRVVPACSYAATWIERHPEYQGLVVE